MRWEVFIDPGYYDMWAVRPEGDKDFSSPQLFHFAKESDALAFAALAEKGIAAVPRKCRHYYGGPSGSTCYGCGKPNHAT